MSDNEMVDERQPTNKRYNLKTRVKFFDKNIVEDIGKEVQRYTRKMVFLVPQEADETTRFFMAWLPDTQKEFSEVVAVIGHPVNSPCRMALKRGPDDQCERHYMVVMNVGVEEVIRQYGRDGMSLPITILGAHEDSEADYARESGGVYKKSEWDQSKPMGNPDSVIEQEGSNYKKSEWSQAKYKKQKNDW